MIGVRGATRGALAGRAVAGALAALAMLVSACAPARQAGGTGTMPAAKGAGTADSVDVVVLVERHEIDSAVDTLVTWIGPGKVRVSHRAGDAILDTERDRFLVLDPVRRTVRESALGAWEERIRAAAFEARAAADSAAGLPPRSREAHALRFESAGAGDAVAGHPTRRYHLFAERPLFPGEWEDIEQEIWVTTRIALAPAAQAAYRRMQETLDWIDFDARVERPSGVRLRVVQRRRPRGGDDAVTEVETTEVVRVERRRAAASVFEAPAEWPRAATATE